MPPNKISRAVLGLWIILIAAIIVLAVFLGIHFHNINSQVVSDSSAIQNSQIIVSQAIKTPVVSPMSTSTLGSTTFPVSLNFLIPSSAQNLQKVSAQYANNEKGFEVSFILPGSLQNNFFTYNSAVRITTGWQNGPTAYSSNFAMLSGSVKNYSIQARMISGNNDTDVVLEIIAN